MKNIIALALVGLLLGSCGQEETESNESKISSIPVKVAPLEMTTWSRPVVASGRFSADQENMLAFKIGGVIDKIYVSESEAVKKGQLLAKLNPTEINSATAQAEAGLEKAIRDFERAQRLYEDSVATLEQLQNAETALDLAQEQLKSANFNKSYSEIRAIDNGYILQKMANEGEVVSGGMPILRSSMSGGKWKLSAGVSGRDWAKITLGDTASLTSDALPDIIIPSQVTQKSKSASPMSGSFEIELSIDREYADKLASGMFGNATIIPSQNQQGWKIPHSALLDANGGKGYVFVLDNDSTAKRIEVETGELSQNGVLIKSGLEDYKRIIISGSPYLSNGSNISIIN
ncbi:MAG: efflux RND transporter periplasmic adaptor subunit [Bacteroidota bacterium]